MRTPVLALFALGLFVVVAVISFDVEAQFIYQSLMALVFGLLILISQAFVLFMLIRVIRALVRYLQGPD